MKLIKIAGIAGGLVGLVFGMGVERVYADTASSLSLTISGDVALNITSTSSAGDLVESSAATVTVTTNHFTGYKLSIIGSDANGDLTGTTDNTKKLTSISANMSESDFESASLGSNNGLWGFLPSKLNSADNTNYIPAPKSTEVVIATTNESGTADYSLKIGVKANMNTAKDSYKGTFSLLAVGNPAAYTINYVSNDNSASGMPSTQTGSLNSSSVAITSTAPTLTGKGFMGWCTVSTSDENCAGETIQSGGALTFNNINYTTNNTVTLYAMWDANPCTAGKICYIANGTDEAPVEGTMGNQSASAGASLMLLASNYSRAGYGFLGWSTTANPTIGTDTIYGPHETITVPSTISTKGLKLYAVWLASTGTMQEFSTTTCATLTQATVTYDNTVSPNNAVFTVTENTFKALTDNRDGNVYTIARLTDGNCWMLENLRLDENVTADKIATGSQGIGGDFTKLAESESTNFSSSTTANSLYSTGNAYTMPRYNSSNTTARSTSPTGNTVAIYSYGNYYTWAAAKANTTAMTSTSTSDSTATSLCPTNWRLPIGNNSTATYSFGALSVSMGGTSATMSSSTTPTGAVMQARLRQFPNNVLFSGNWNSSSAGYRGSYGFYWSSTAYNSSSAYILSLGSSYVFPGTSSYNKYYGFSVRCVAGS